MFKIALVIADFFLSQKINQILWLVCCNEGITYDVVKQLSNRSLSTTVLHWKNNDDVFLRSILSGRTGAVLDSSCNSLNDAFQWIKVVNGNWSQVHYVHWLVLSDKDFNSDAVSQHHICAPVTIASMKCYLSQLLVLFYHFNPIMKMGFLAGYWSSENGLELYSDFQWYLNQSLHNVTVTTTLLSSGVSQQRRHKYDNNILHLLAEALHFRIQEVHSRGLYSKLSELHLLRQLADGSTNVSPSSILVTTDKIGLADFTFAIGYFRPYIYYKVQSVLSARNIYILPFSPGVWITLSALLLTITASLTFILRYESHLTLSKEKAQPKWEFGEVLLVTVGAICQQGSARNPTASAARTLFITLFVLAVLMYTAYSASVISLLSSPSSVISTLHGILHHSTSMDLVLLDSHYYHVDFKGEVAFCADREEAHTYLHHSGEPEETLCNVGEIPLLQGPPYQRCFALRRGSCYTQIFNSGILKLKQFGLLQREQRYWFTDEPFCESPDPPPGLQFVSIMLSNIYPLLHLLSMGIFCAIILLPLELLLHYSRKWYQIRYGSQMTFPGFQLLSLGKRKRMRANESVSFVY